MYAHERVTLSVVAEAIAQIKGAKFAGHYDSAKRYSGNVFFVPDDTLVLDEASCLGIRLPAELFGAVQGSHDAIRANIVGLRNSATISVA